MNYPFGLPFDFQTIDIYRDPPEKFDIPPVAFETFDIITTIRSDALLFYSQDNTRVNANIDSELARIPVPFYMLGYHRDRMLNTAIALGWDTSQLQGPKGFEKLLDLLHDHLQSEHNDRNYAAPLMLRIALTANRNFKVETVGPQLEPAAINQFWDPPSVKNSSILYPRSLSTVADPTLGASYLNWRVFITFKKVKPNLFTRHKTSDRGKYAGAKILFPGQRSAQLVLNGVKLQTEILIVNERWEIMEGFRFTPYFRRDNKWITPATACGGNLGTTRRWALEQGLCEEGVVHGGGVRQNEIIVLSNGARGFQAGIVQEWKTLLTDGE